MPSRNSEIRPQGEFCSGIGRDCPSSRMTSKPSRRSLSRVSVARAAVVPLDHVVDESLEAVVCRFLRFGQILDNFGHSHQSPVKVTWNWRIRSSASRCCRSAWNSIWILASNLAWCSTISPTSSSWMCGGGRRFGACVLKTGLRGVAALETELAGFAVNREGYGLYYRRADARKPPMTAAIGLNCWVVGSA
jgi:hypothetical protein